MSQPTSNPGQIQVVVLSAAGHDQLRRSVRRLRDHLATADAEGAAPALADVAYTLQIGRVALAHRVAVRCADLAGLLAGLDAFGRGDAHDSVLHGVAGRPTPDGGAEPGSAVAAAADWVAGRDIAWQRYWPVPGARVSLPTYPFGREDAEVPAGAAVSASASDFASDGAPTVAAASAAAVAELEGYLVEVYSQVSGIPAASLSAHVPLTEYGLSSFLIGRLNTRLEQDLGERSRTLFFEHADLSGVAATLAARHRTPAGPGTATAAPASEPSRIAASTRASDPLRAKGSMPTRTSVSDLGSRRPPVDHAMAVIGIAGRYPQAPDLERFWENLAGGRDCVTPLPPERARPGWPVHLMEGGYVDDVDRFDPLLFGITPREAALIDPQERVFLEVTWEALESAGYTRGRLRHRHGSRVAVYAGAMWNEYPMFGVEQSMLGAPSDSGATLGGIANRVSYFFDLNGPSLTVDTMCSSSLVALDLAVQCLRRGESDVAIIGAVSLSLHPNKFRQQSRMQLTASDRRSHSFGAGGDGFVPSEGAGVLVLKPLDRAEADGDPIHAVVLGTGVVHAGRTNGYIVPSPVAQAEVVRRALRDARVEPSAVGYIEAHGAGTALGDPVEVDGLNRVFGEAGLPAGAIPIGSVKSTIGHAEAAAGLAGLTKIILQLRHGTLAPSLHADELNPNIDWDIVPFRVQRERSPWTGPRVAGVSSFGAGGTIAHAVVAGHTPAPLPERSAPGAQLIVLSAFDDDRLDAVARRLAAHLRRGVDPGSAPDPGALAAALARIAAGELADGESAAELAARFLAGTGPSGPALADIAHTLQVGREPLRQRLAVVATSVADLCAALDNHRDNPRVIHGRAPAATDLTAPVLPASGLSPSDPATLADIGRHWVAGGPVDWDRLHDSARAVVDLPSYPFARLRCWLTEAAAPPVADAAAAGPVAAAGSPGPDVETPLYEKGWELAGPAGPPTTGSGGVMVCVGAGDAVARRLGGVSVRDEADLIAVLDHSEDIGGWVDLADLPGADSSGPRWEDRLAMLRRLLAERPRARLRVLHVVSGLQGPPGPSPRADGARMSGFVKMLGAEYARVTATVLDTDEPHDPTGHVLAEWPLPDPYGEVAYRAGHRYVPRLRQVAAPHAPLRCDPNAAYLVTGGTRGTGALVARHLVDRGARRIALVGRRPGTPEADATVRALEARGARVLVHTGGLERHGELAAFVATVRSEFGRLDGVVHCAGIGSQGRPALVHKEIADVRAVMAPKVDALEALAELCAADRPSFFLVFSSVCSTVPGLAAGVSDYAAANAAVDAMVRHHVPAGRTEFRSVDWPQWSQTGSTSTLPNPCAPFGIGPLDDAAGLRVVDRVLALPTGTVVLPCPPLGATPPDPQALLSVRPPAETPAPAWAPVPASAPLSASAPPAAASSSAPPVPVAASVAVPGPATVPAVAPGSAAAPTPAPFPPPVSAPALVPVVAVGLTWLVELFSDALGIPVPDLDPTVEFGDLGVDSVMLGDLLVRIENHIDRPLDPATLLLYSTLDQLGDHLGVTPEPPPPPPTREWQLVPEHQTPLTTPATDDAEPGGWAVRPVPAGESAIHPSSGAAEVDGRIAVIGMACRFPGASDLATLWDNLVGGRCSVTEVPLSRWDHRRWWSPEPGLGRTISKWGGFVDGIEDFDPDYFDMGEDEARCLDPAIRMFLETTAACLAEAGYEPDELRGRRVAVVAGARLSDYGRRVPIRSDVLRSDQNFIAARVAHQFDLRGPGLVVDSACSSSLVSVQTACRSLLAGESELAVAGGVEVLLDEHVYIDLSAARALSPTGRCRTFDEHADGFVPAEGCGVVLLKPLAAALADGDRVHAVIEAVAVNNDGHTMGVTTPSPAAQAEVVRQALAMAGRSPAEIGLLEAHGTGTMIGDPIELRALTEVFAGSAERIEIGSVKSNLGHLLSAAGMAGLFKIVLALEHGRIPPTLFCEKPNPRFDFGRSPLRPTTRTVDWPAGARVAGVSSFGLGGTNAHLVASGLDPGLGARPRRNPLPPPRFRRRRLWLNPEPAPVPVPAVNGDRLVASLLDLDLVAR